MLHHLAVRTHRAERDTRHSQATRPSATRLQPQPAASSAASPSSRPHASAPGSPDQIDAPRVRSQDQRKRECPALSPNPREWTRIEDHHPQGGYLCGRDLAEAADRGLRGRISRRHSRLQRTGSVMTCTSRSAPAAGAHAGARSAAVPDSPCRSGRVPWPLTWRFCAVASGIGFSMLA
jgi:hypothetical protein